MNQANCRAPLHPGSTSGIKFGLHKQASICPFLYAESLINNGNCTEWSAIWSEIKRVITKSHDREAGVRFVITSLISDQNCTTRSAISTLLHSF